MNTSSSIYCQNINFKAFRICTATNNIKNELTKIDLYELNRFDMDFLLKLKEKTDFRKIVKNSDAYKIQRWQDVFDYCIDSACNSLITTILAIHNNKPCGIMTYNKKGTSYELDGICSIPTENNKKVNLAGQTLIYHLFNEVIKNKGKNIFLFAITDGPFDAVKKYESLGFKKDIDYIVNDNVSGERSKSYIPMHCNTFNILKSLKKMQSLIKFEETNPIYKRLDELI